MLKCFTKQKSYFSLNTGTKKNNHICMLTTVTNWKIIFPAKFLRRYKALSTIIETNCNSNIIRNVTGILFSSKYEATPPSPCVDCKRGFILYQIMITFNVIEFCLTPNAVNPNNKTKKLIKSQRKMYAYTSAVTRFTCFKSFLKNAVQDEQYFFVLCENRHIVYLISYWYHFENKTYDNAAIAGK